MQRGYLSSQPGWLTNFLARRPLGLANPRKQPNLAPNSSGLLGMFPAEDSYATSRYGSDALIQRILDEAASKRPPTGLFDPRETGSSEAPVPAAFRGAAPSVANPQDIHTSTPPSTSDALVQRILDEAASKRPPIGLFDPRAV